MKRIRHYGPGDHGTRAFKMITGGLMVMLIAMFTALGSMNADADEPFEECGEEFAECLEDLADEVEECLEEALFVSCLANRLLAPGSRVARGNILKLVFRGLLRPPGQASQFLVNRPLGRPLLF